jgi:hypothetical protein
MPPLVAVSLPADSGTLLVHGTPKPSDVKTDTEEDQSVEDQKEGSSTVEPITWGQYKQTTTSIHEWEQIPMLASPNSDYLHGSCSVCDKPMGTSDPSQVMTCYACTKWIADCHKLIEKDRDTHEGGDDEQEFLFTGIPIAGENDGDTDEEWASDESEQEEDNLP